MNKVRVGFALTGSFCTFAEVIKQIELLAKDYDIIPIMSFNASNLDTRFGKASEHIDKIEKITGKKVIKTIEEAEPIGPKNMTDIMVVAPCTGNTLAKLSWSITDTPVTMAVKSHLRNNRPVIIAVSTNDALSGSAKNIGALQNTKNYYFVPYKQDNYKAKPTSIVADFCKIPDTIEYVLKNNKQIQPIIRNINHIK